MFEKKLEENGFKFHQFELRGDFYFRSSHKTECTFYQKAASKQNNISSYFSLNIYLTNLLRKN